MFNNLLYKGLWNKAVRLVQPEPIAVKPDSILLPHHHEFNKELFKYTPDVLKITRYVRQNVFLYGPPAPCLTIRGTTRLGTGYTSREYLLYKKMDGKETLPFALECKPEDVRGGYHGAFSHMIKGTMYSMFPYQLIELDKFMFNTVHFQRKRVTILVPYRQREYGSSVYGDELIEPVRAHIYLAKNDYWLEQIYENPKAYNIVRSFTSRRHGNYYCFNEKLESNTT